MTEKAQDAPLEGVQEPAATPMPVVPSDSSQAEGSAPTGPDVSTVVEAALKEFKASLDKELADLVDARFKSAKDKRFSDVDKLSDWVRKSGGNFDSIKTEVELEEVRGQLSALQAGSQGAVGAAPNVDADWTKAQAETDIILRGAGIAPDDPGYSHLVEQYRGKVKPKDWPDIVDRYARSNRGNPAVAAGSGGGTSPTSPDPETLSRRIIEATQRGAPTAEIKKLKDELSEALKSA